MFIQTETTPYPARLKFLPGCPVMEKGTADFTDANDARRSPLATALFGWPTPSRALQSRSNLQVRGFSSRRSGLRYSTSCCAITFWPYNSLEHISNREGHHVLLHDFA